MLTPIPLIDGVLLPASVAAQYTSPKNVSTIIKKVTVTNTDGSAGRLVTIYKVAPLGAAGTSNIVIDARAIGPLATLDITEMINKVLAGGGTIQAFADAAGVVNIQADGIQYA